MKDVPSIAIKRTCVRHERGTLFVHIIILLIANIGVYYVAYWLITRQQVYSVPNISNSRELTINWGAHD